MTGAELIAHARMAANALKNMAPLTLLVGRLFANDGPVLEVQCHGAGAAIEVRFKVKNSGRATVVEAVRATAPRGASVHPDRECLQPLYPTGGPGLEPGVERWLTVWLKPPAKWRGGKVFLIFTTREDAPIPRRWKQSAYRRVAA